LKSSWQAKLELNSKPPSHPAVTVSSGKQLRDDYISHEYH